MAGSIESFAGQDWVKKHGNGHAPPEIDPEDIRVAPEQEANARPRSKQRYPLQWFNDIKPSTAADYLVKGLIPRGGLVVFWGPPKCGKSFLVFDIMMHVALGRPYRGRRVQQGIVVYCALEGGQGFRKRIEAWRRHNLAGHDGDVPLCVLSVPVDLIADHPGLVAAIKAQVGQLPVASVVIDTLNRALNGDENGEDMTKFVNAADYVRRHLDCTVPVVHHCGINGTRPRGYTSLPGAIDAQIEVKSGASGEIVATVEFMRDDEGGAVVVSRLEKVELGLNDDGDLMTSCVVVPVDGVSATTPQKTQLSDNDKLALDALKKVLADCGERPPASNHIPQRDILVARVDVWRSYFYAIKDGKGTRRKRHSRAPANDCKPVASLSFGPIMFG